jgi:dTDP-glucose 4,6-dehydratase
MPRTVVAGGAGFIGSHVCERLLAEGHEIVCLDNFTTGCPENVSHLRDSRFELIKHDITKRIEIEGPVDYVLHLASPASPVDFLNMPIQTLKVGSLGTHNALGLARAKGARFLLASTSEVYGDPDIHPQPESYPGKVNPIGLRSVYDESKRFAEAITMAYHRFHRLDTRIARIFNTYGPRMRLSDGRVVPNFIGQALRGVPLTVYGDGRQTRSFCYVDDLVEGLWRLLNSDVDTPVNIGTPFEHTIEEFARLIIRLVASDSEIIYKPLLTEDDPRARRPDTTKAETLLGWTPRVSLEQGLQRTIEWFRSRLSVEERAH